MDQDRDISNLELELKLELELNKLRKLVSLQSEMISSLTSSLQATYLLLCEKGVISLDEDAKVFEKYYIQNLAKMDQAQSAIYDRLGRSNTLNIS